MFLDNGITLIHLLFLNTVREKFVLTRADVQCLQGLFQHSSMDPVRGRMYTRAPCLLNLTELKINHILKTLYLLDREYVSFSAVMWTEDNSELKLPEPPTNCCMSGCANCVWIQYAEDLSKIFKDGGKKSREIILNKVDDPNMKAFLLTELRCMELKKS